MDEEKQDRKRLLLRKARRSRELGLFIEKLSAATGLQADSFRFLSLEEADAIASDFESFYANELSSRDKLIAEWSDPARLHSVLAEIGSLDGDGERLVLFPCADVFGALVLPSQVFWAHASQVLLAEGNCLRMLRRPELRSGVHLDLYEKGASGTFFYEVRAWGSYRELLEQSLARLDPAKLLAPPDLRS